MKEILIAEDELQAQALYDEILLDMGHSPRCARNGREALELFKNTRPDLVILDIKMPEVHGLEVLESIRRIDPDVPILICSAYPRLKNDRLITTMNVFDFINKPIDVDVFRAKVQEALSYAGGGVAPGRSEGGRGRGAGSKSKGDPL